ncbi:MAG: EVE domain-containing protein [Myxococcales bacterium]|nr:EVE domain-containing protein [Myxococcales bacterium]
MKSEPDVFSIDDLATAESECWDGVRNFRARNFMREMKVGDLVLFYHSNAKPPGVAGLCRVCRTAYPDHTQFDPQSKYFDKTASREKPRWEMVDVEFVERFPHFLPLDDLRHEADLDGMMVIKRGMRLSVQPVETAHFKHVLRMAGAKTRVR